MVLYEYPFNESIRTMLRLEHMFDRLGQLMARTTSIDHHYALATIFEIMDVASRADLKSDLLKELERHKAQLAGYRGNPSISEAALDDVIARIDQAFADLNQHAGKAGNELTGNEWLMSIRSRISIPGGTCEFDLPAYYAWQQHEAAQRQADLTHWASALTPLAGRCRCCSNCFASPARRTRWRQARASTSKVWPRVAATSCCACRSTLRCGSSRRSAATDCWCSCA